MPRAQPENTHRRDFLSNIVTRSTFYSPDDFAVHAFLSFYICLDDHKIIPFAGERDVVLQGILEFSSALFAKRSDVSILRITKEANLEKTR